MPRVVLRLSQEAAAELEELAAAPSSPGRYVADVFRRHLQQRKVAAARALDAQILAYQPLCRSVARKMWRQHLRRCLPGSESSGGAGHVDLEEVELEVQAELVRCAHRWDPTRGVTLGAYAEQWLLAAARKAIQRTWAGDLPEEDAPLSTVDSQEGLDLASLPRDLRRAAAAVAGTSRAAVDVADLHRLAQALGASVRVVPLRQLAERLGVAPRTLQARAAAGKLPGAVRTPGGAWHVVEATSKAWQDSSDPSQPGSPGAPVRRLR